MPVIDSGNQTDQLICSEGFYFDVNATNLCRPTCGEFFPVGFASLIIIRSAVSISFVASVVMFILALTIQREVM